MLAYRADIDGLRAVAVLAVVLFHAGINGFSGGFVGVDVFFVISGFLIASNILRELGKGTFSVAEFYERRVRRIFPPLFVVLGVAWVAAYFLLLPRGITAFAKTLLSATLFSSNFVFWLDSGYFSAAADTKPLLHTWSLCVEEQFYMLFPVVVAGLFRFGRGGLPWVMGAVTLASFALSTWGVSHASEATFFLAPARAWELLLGTLLALDVLPKVERPMTRHLLGVAGLLAILGAALCFSTRTPFPGPWALVPCLGTVAVIHSGAGEGGIVTRALSSRLPVSVGLVSYGLYLWHWPILVFAREAAIVPLEPKWTVLCLLCAGLLAVASYYVVERPIRERRLLASRRSVFGGGLLAMAGASALALVSLSANGFPGRLPARALAYAKQARGPAPTLKRYCHDRSAGKGARAGRCVIGAQGEKPHFLVWGDSHAAALAPALAAAGVQTHRAGLLEHKNGCRPLLGVRAAEGSPSCESFNAKVAERVKSKTITDVVLVARWGLAVEGTGYKNERGIERVIVDDSSREASMALNADVFRRGLSRTLSALASSHKHVIVALPVPEVGWQVASTFARMVWWGRTVELRPTRDEYLARQRKTLSILSGLRREFAFDVVDPTEVLCDARFCEVERNGKLFYKDDDHLTERAALRIAPLFARAFEATRPSSTLGRTP